MSSQGKDPNIESVSSGGGYVDMGLHSLGGGLGLQIVLAVTLSRSIVDVSTSSVQLAPANTSRYGTKIVNTSMIANLYVVAGSAATVGAGQKIAPGSTALISYNGTGTAGAGAAAGVPSLLAINGIWDQSDAAGEAIIDDITL